MRTSKYVTFALTALVAVALSTSPVLAGNWGWDRDAGAKARGEFGGEGSQKASDRYSQCCYTTDPREPVVQSRSTASQQSDPEVSFLVGDRVKIVKDKASLMRGSEVLATLTQGEDIIVVEVQEQWIGTSVKVDGQDKLGWILASKVVGVTDEVAPTRKPTKAVSESQQKSVIELQQTSYYRVAKPQGRDCSPRYFGGSSSSHEGDVFGLREFNPYNIVAPRYETDPNIHDWRPWLAH